MKIGNLKGALAAAISVLLVLLAISTSACSGNTGGASGSSGSADTNNAASGADRPARTSPVTITQLGYDRGTIPSSEGTLQGNWFTKGVGEIVLERYNIKLEYVFVANAQREQKLATMLASGSAPDICMSYANDVIMNYSRQNGLTDLEPYLDEYGGNITRVSVEGWKDKAKIDGKLTRLFVSPVMFADTTFVRKDWLDKLGLEPPTSPQEFYDMLKAFKTEDPGKLGDKGIPFAFQGTEPGGTAGNSGPFTRLPNVVLQGFLETPPSEEKLVTPYQLWPEVKEMYRYLNRLYNEGLMGEFILDKDQSLYKAKIVKGELGATVMTPHYMGHSAYGGLQDALQKNIPEAGYVQIFPWKDPEAGEYIYELFLNNADAFQSFFIPKSSKHPQEAFMYLDFMASDEYLTLAISGVEGVDFEMADGIPQAIDAEAFNNRISWIQPQYQTFASNKYVKDQEKSLKVYASAFVGESSIAEFLRSTISGELASKYSRPVIAADQPMQAKYSADLATKWASFEAKMVLGPVGEFDSNFDSALKTWREEGGDLWANEAKELYNKQYGK